LCGLGEIHRLVTDSGIPKEYCGILEATGVETHLAPLEEAKDPDGSSISEPCAP